MGFFFPRVPRLGLSAQPRGVISAFLLRPVPSGVTGLEALRGGTASCLPC